MTLGYVFNDGGRDSDGFGHEFNDCVVRAISIAYCEPYEVIHAQLKELGRKDGDGISTVRAMRGRSFIWEKRQKEMHTSLGRFVREHPIGHYVIRVRGHAIALIDGIIHDRLSNSKGLHVLAAWKII